MARTARDGRAAFVGIDVAFAKGKRLPVCFVTTEDGVALVGGVSKRAKPLPPSGGGNAKTLDASAVQAFARDTVEYLRSVEAAHSLRIVRVAIDAPSAPCLRSPELRAAERAMADLGYSFIATPSAAAFTKKKKAAREHLALGEPVSTMPAANQLWMLVGFELFKALRAEPRWEVVEVYPHAIIQRLGLGGAGHKSGSRGYEAQLQKAAELSRIAPATLAAQLNRSVHGSRHDKLDAFFAAWVASLPESEREYVGELPDDAICVPRQR